MWFEAWFAGFWLWIGHLETGKMKQTVSIRLSPRKRHDMGTGEGVSVQEQQLSPSGQEGFLESSLPDTLSKEYVSVGIVGVVLREQISPPNFSGWKWQRSASCLYCMSITRLYVYRELSWMTEHPLTGMVTTLWTKLCWFWSQISN